LLASAACGKVSEHNVDAPAQADASLVDAAPLIDAPPPSKKAFISSLTFFADFGGTSQADTACQNMAAAAGLVGVYRAWLSTTAADSVVNRFSHSTVPYTLVNGTVIATSFADLVDGTIAHGIDLTETGVPLTDTGITMCHGAPTCAQTFTNTLADGTVGPTANNNSCLNWTTRIFQPPAPAPLNTFIAGDSTMATSSWTLRGSGFRCDFQARFYCFQQ
jgi:hypothetical protein